MENQVVEANGGSAITSPQPTEARGPISEWSLEKLNRHLRVAYNSGFFNNPRIQLLKDEIRSRITTA